MCMKKNILTLALIVTESNLDAWPSPPPLCLWRGQNFFKIFLQQYAHQKDQCDTLIIMRYVCWGNYFLAPAGPRPSSPPPPL